MNFPKCVCTKSVDIYSKIRTVFASEKIGDRQLMAFSTFTSCRLNEIAHLSGVFECLFQCKPNSVNAVSRVLYKLASSLSVSSGNKQWILNILSTANEASCHESATELYCNHLNIPFKYVAQIKRIVSEISQQELNGVHLNTTNAVGIYLYCKSRLPQISVSDIAFACNRNENTIFRNVAKLTTQRQSEVMLFS